jgi:hypothetical protein
MKIAIVSRSQFPCRGGSHTCGVLSCAAGLHPGEKRGPHGAGTGYYSSGSRPRKVADGYAIASAVVRAR